jgi:hypothetical protein
MIITNSGRPVERFPLFVLRRGAGSGFSLNASMFPTSETSTVAEAFYTPLVVIQSVKTR